MARLGRVPVPASSRSHHGMEPDARLVLAAEMKLPGRAWLEFEVTPAEGGSRITQTAVFDPLGLGGRLYWAALYPLHAIVFGGMLRGIARAASRSGVATS